MHKQFYLKYVFIFETDKVAAQFAQNRACKLYYMCFRFAVNKLKNSPKPQTAGPPFEGKLYSFYNQ